MTDSLDVTFTNLSQLSRVYGAPAVEMAERIIKYNAIEQLALSGVGLIGVMVFCTFFILPRIKKDDLDDPNAAAILLSVFGGLACMAISIASIIELVDVWAWTALVDPQLALAHKIFGSMGG